MRLFSEIFPATLYENESPISGRIKVVEQGATRKLLVGALVQSVSETSPNVANKFWGRLSSFPRFDFPPSVLILGLGGGTMAHLVSKFLKPRKIVGVEIDPQIVEVGYKFFNLDRLKGLEVITADAEAFLRGNRERYDYIVVDVYLGRRFPPFLESQEALEKINSDLTAVGLVAFNRIFLSSRPRRRLSFRDKLSRVFRDVQEEIIESPADAKNHLYWARHSPTAFRAGAL